MRSVWSPFKVTSEYIKSKISKKPPNYFSIVWKVSSVPVYFGLK